MTASTDLSATSPEPEYIGRFAPSPTGPLHMGSLVAALASYLDARANAGQWLIRMEDLDPPRESREAADQILFCLDALGLQWDGPLLYQSSRSEAYLEAISLLQCQGRIFACDCSRQLLQEVEGIYPGTCRSRHLRDQPGLALRCQVNADPVEFIDRLQGHQAQNLEREVGDFVIRRKEGLFAYQLAVVVDDAFQGITHIVRGIDLIDSTPRQLYLQRLLGFPTPVYAHIPVIVNDRGQKLSKQQMAEAIDPAEQGELLVKALLYLRLSPPPELAASPPREVLAWAIRHWAADRLAGIKAVAERS